MGYFPADNPRYVGIVMFDEPKTSIYGGEVSAPVFRNIARRYVSLPRNNFMAHDADEIKREEVLLTRISDDSRGEKSGARIIYADAVEVHRATSAEEALPDFRGKTIRDAYQIARSLGLKCDISGGGLVQYQEPVPGIAVNSIDEVKLYGK